MAVALLRLTIRRIRGSEIILARTAGDNILEIPEGTVGNLLEGLLGKKGLVTADNDVGEREETHEDVVLDDVAAMVVVKNGCFVFIDVEGDAGEAAVLEGVDDGSGIDQAAARGVDEDGVVGEQRQGMRVDDVLGRLGERAVEAQDVALREEVGEGVDVGAVGGEGRVGERVVGEDAAAEAGGHDAGEGDADAARADEADGFAVEGAAGEADEGEVAFPDAGVGAVGFAVEGLQEGDGELGDGFGAVGGDVGDGEAEGLGGGEVDVVGAGAAEEDGADATGREVGENGAGELVVYEDADGIGRVFCDEGDGFQVERDRVKGELDAGVGIGGAGGLEVVLVVGFRAEDGEFDGHFDFVCFSLDGLKYLNGLAWSLLVD